MASNKNGIEEKNSRPQARKPRTSLLSSFWAWLTVGLFQPKKAEPLLTLPTETY